MKLVPLTKGYEAMVDDEDYDRVSQHMWQALTRPDNDTVYASRSWQERPSMKIRREALHVFIMGRKQGFTIDHEDKNPLNCQKYNMRWATKSQQNANRRLSTKEYRGVYPVSGSVKWEPRIWYQRKLYKNGSYYNIEDAARAYDELAKRIYGEFATVNFP
jgi:hypothetical protein